MLFVAKIFLGLRGFLIRIANKLVPEKFIFYETTQQFWLPKLIGVCVELEIPDKLIDGPLSINQLAEQTNTKPGALYRFMRALSGEGVFIELDENHFANTKKSLFLTASKSDSIKYMVEHQLNDKNWEMLGNIKEVLHTGQPVSNKVMGTNIFDYLQANPTKNELYNKAMTNSTNMLYNILPRYYPFKKFPLIVDVGGGHGFLLGKILADNPGCKGILFDLPHVVENATEKLVHAGISGRVNVVPGDIFHEIPKNGHLYILKNILHAFGDEKCIQILQNIKHAALPTSRVIVLEMAVNEKNVSAYGKIFDIQMMLGLDGGRERTTAEYQNLFKKAGIIFTKEIKTISAFSIFEGKMA